jgi:hypothetical protein
VSELVAGLGAERRRRFWWLPAMGLLAAIAVAVAPLLFLRVVPLVDYPTHLARMSVLAALDTSPALQQNYVADWGIKPNLAMDAAVLALARLMPVEDAMRLFLALAIALQVSGTAVLHRVLWGKFDLWTAAAALFVFNIALAGGFINFVFGVGLLLYALAAWCATEAWPVRRRLPLLALLCVLLFFSHLLVLCMYGLATAAYAGGRMLAARRIDRAALATLFGQFAGAAALWPFKPAGPPLPYFAFGDLGDRLVAIASPMIFLKDAWDLALAGVVLFAVLYLWRSGSLRLAPGMGWVLGALAAGTLLMPTHIMGGALAHVRLPVALAFVAVAATRCVPRHPGFVAILAAGTLALLAARTAQIVETWRMIERDYDEFRAASAVIPPGSRILPVQLPSGERDSFYVHLFDLAAIDRCAFIPHMPKIPDQQPLLPSPANRAVDAGAGMGIGLGELSQGADAQSAAMLEGLVMPGWQHIYWARWPETFDYAVVLRFQQTGNPMPEHLALMRSGSFFDIYRILPGRPPAPPLPCTPAR